MFRYHRILGTVCVGIYGLFVKARWPEGLLDMDALLNIFIPSADDGWFMAFYGLIFGIFVVPYVIELIERGKEYDRFYRDFRTEGLGQTRSTFFTYLCRAYGEWHKTHTDLPESLEDLIDETAFPDWIPVLDGELLEVIKQQYCNGVGPPLWQFANELYSEIDSYLKSRTPTKLLISDEAQSFHNARQRLSYFWEDAGFVALRMKKLRYRLIKRHLKSDERLLKMLCLLSLALHLANKQKGKGGRHMYYLCALYFGTRNRGFCEWISNPLLEPSERWRV